MKRALFLLICSTISCFLAYGQQDPYPYRFEGIFEEYGSNRLALIAKFLPFNCVVLEAGAHYGTDTINFVKQWPAGKILCFEPNPNAFTKLCENTKQFNNVQRYNLALGDHNGMSTFHVCYGTGGKSPEFEGASSLLPPSPAMEIHYQGPTIEVPCVILDEWCKQNKIDHIDFMWLDLEGFELQALKNSPQILSTVKVIYTETNFFPFRVGTTQYQTLKRFLEQSGFQLLSHWYREGLQGDAIFVKKEIYEAVFRGSNIK